MVYLDDLNDLMRRTNQTMSGPGMREGGEADAGPSDDTTTSIEWHDGSSKEDQSGADTEASSGSPPPPSAPSGNPSGSWWSLAAATVVAFGAGVVTARALSNDDYWNTHVPKGTKLIKKDGKSIHSYNPPRKD
jgi:hypothetical protein